MVRLQVTRPSLREGQGASKSAPKTTGEAKQDGYKAVQAALNGVGNIDELAINEEKFEQILQKLKEKKKPYAVPQPAKTRPAKPVKKARAMTEDGLYVYSAEELRIGQKGSGMTDKCPFDCDCCF